MSVVIILILASLAVGVGFVGAFVWSVRSGQYEDTFTPSMRMLLDDATPRTHSPPAEAVAAPVRLPEIHRGGGRATEMNLTTSGAASGRHDSRRAAS